MDTKWKKFKHSTGTKISAILLAILLICSIILGATFFLQSSSLSMPRNNNTWFYKMASNEMERSFTNALPDFALSTTGSALIYEDITSLIEWTTYYRNDDYAQSEYAQKDLVAQIQKEKKQKIDMETKNLIGFYCAYRDYIQNVNHGKALDDFRALGYDDNIYPGSYYSHEYYMSENFRPYEAQGEESSVASAKGRLSFDTPGNTDVETTHVNEYEYRVDYTKETFTLDYAQKNLSTNAFAGLQSAITKKSEEINDTYAKEQTRLENAYFSEYKRLSEFVKEPTSLQYIIYNRTTDTLLTNIEGVQKDSDYISFVRNMPWSASNMQGQKTTSEIFINSPSPTDKLLVVPSFTKDDVEVYVGFTESIKTMDDVYTSAYNNYIDLQEMFFPAIINLIVCAVLLIAVFIFLGSVFGRKAGTDEIQMTWVDRIYNDLHLAIFIGLISILFGVFITVIDLLSPTADMTEYVLVHVPRTWAVFTTPIDVLNEKLFPFLLPISAAMGAVIVSYFASFMRHIKNKTLWKHTLLYKGWKYIKRFFHWLFSPIRYIMNPEKFQRRNIIWFILYLLSNFVLTILLLSSISLYSSVLALLYIGGIIIINLLFLRYFLNLNKGIDHIIQAVNSLQEGNFDILIEPHKLPKELQPFGRNIQTIQTGLSTAVEEAIRGETLKTQLITNVSHDLKTPLTSIINYVDLLKRCDIDDPKAKEYLQVLTDKSQRLKYLIEDLVEASKATTGNIQLQRTQLNLHQLLIQCIGENEAGFEKRNLQLRINEKGAKPLVFADSQKTWRIVDNLLNNAQKYALAGSRIYIDITQDDQYGIFSVRNVSEKELNISPDDLMQRFVRGDSARTTEGSGLGLSIAESLCTLQGGQFDLHIDGDLFAATVKLPLYNNQDKEETEIKPITPEEYLKQGQDSVTTKSSLKEKLQSLFNKK